MQVYITAIEEGFLYGLLALGIYISLRILDIPDLTTEGSFGFGSAVAAVVAAQGFSLLSFIAAFAAGVLVRSRFYRRRKRNGDVIQIMLSAKGGFYVF